MSHFSDLLRQTRETLGKSLAAIGAGQIPRQTLSNYERGASLPRPAALPRIAQLYGISLEELRLAYTSTAPRSAQGAYDEEFYQGVLRSLIPEDHLVTVTQQSLAQERVVASFITDLVAKGARKTFVAYEPSGPAPFSGENVRWATNHQAAARTLAEEFSARGIPTDGEGLRYLLIGNPTLDDLFFLQGYGGSPFLVRSAASHHDPYQAWHQMRSIEGRRWWIPHSGDHIGAMRHWLTYACGLDLPRTKAPPSAPNKEARELRLLTLADYLAQ